MKFELCEIEGRPWPCGLDEGRLHLNLIASLNPVGQDMDVNVFKAEEGKTGAVFAKVDFDDVGFHGD